MKTCIVINDINDPITNESRKEVEGLDQEIEEIINKFFINDSYCRDFFATTDSGIDDSITYYDDDYLINPKNIVVCNNKILGHVSFGYGKVSYVPFEVYEKIYHHDTFVEHFMSTDVSDIMSIVIIKIKDDNSNKPKDESGVYDLEKCDGSIIE